MYNKPLTARMDNGPHDAPGKTSHRARLRSADFASYLPQAAQGALQPGGLQSGQAGGSAPLEQAASQGNLGFNQMKALAALTSVTSGKTGEARGDAASAPQGLPLNPRDLFKLLTKGSIPDAESAETAVRVKSHRKKDAAKKRGEEGIGRKANGSPEELRQNSAAGAALGKLAANFESGRDGIAAVGYDRHGGTSYGKYQFSSRAGTMKQFVEFLRTEAPDMAEKLQKAGVSNTGGRRGKMPETWKEIAETDPGRFEDLQDKFIRASHFEPAMRAIAEKAGMDWSDMPFALQEVVFSTAVQHGPNAASRIISRALGQMGETALNPEESAPEELAKAQENLIRKIYQSRSGQFASSTESVQAAVKSRLRQEMGMAITLLRQERAPGTKA